VLDPPWVSVDQAATCSFPWSDLTWTDLTYPFCSSLCSGQEMEARKQLFGDHLKFELAPERCCIHVAREGGAHAVWPAGPGAADA